MSNPIRMGENSVRTEGRKQLLLLSDFNLAEGIAATPLPPLRTLSILISTSAPRAFANLPSPSIQYFQKYYVESNLKTTKHSWQTSRTAKARTA